MNPAESDLDRCEKRIGYRFSDRSLLKTALTHSSCANTHIDSNERLEFLGDATLGLVVSNLLFKLFPKKTEGELSQLKATIVSRRTCRHVATRLELNKYLQIGKGMTSIPDSLVANVMESVIGAIFIDGGFEEVRLFIEEIFKEEIDVALQTEAQNMGSVSDSEITPPKLSENYKTQLQTKTQRAASHLKPEYVSLDETGPPHDRNFKVAAKVDNVQYQAAWGKSKKEAEQRAAGNALYQMRGLDPPFSDQL